MQYLQPRQGESYLDVTAGYGGHATQILERTAAPQSAVLVDRDSNAIRQLEKVFAGKPVEIVHNDFLQASRMISGQGRQFDMVLADLGVSSPHLDQASRGFAISGNGPLDMRMDQTQALTAATIVNDYAPADIASILRRYGEEPKAMAIARKIAEERPITSASQLAEIVKRVWPGQSRVHPATRTFQALRIAVNDELSMIEQALPVWIDMLKPGGRLAVISFHSLEDRLVKQAFAEAGSADGSRYDAPLTILTKKPVVAEATESVLNPRARSAKLRAAVKK